MLTTSQAARVLDVDPSTVRRWVNAGRIPHEPSPYGALFDEQTIETLAKERERHGNQGSRQERNPGTG